MNNEFTIDITSDGTNNSVDFRSNTILGHCRHRMLIKDLTLSYELVGAPIDGLTINGETGAWEQDASAPAYQELTAGEQKTVTVTYAVR